MKHKFHFMCGHFVGTNFIYAVTVPQKSWHYFEEIDSNSSVHDSLPAMLDSSISTLKKVSTIEVHLDDEQSKNYYYDGKFMFKNKELKTCLQLHSKQSEESDPSKIKLLPKNSVQLMFIAGQTNPLLFLNEYEKCRDLKTDKDKMFKIRNFVDQSHRARFSEHYFTSDWPTVRRDFLKTYSLLFTANKKKELNIDYDEEDSLRSFVGRKLESLSLYTTLPFINQVELVLNDLPNQISNLFLLEEKMICKKQELLEFCDSIQDLVQTMRQMGETTDQEPQTIREPLNQMEIFDFDEDSVLESMAFNDSATISRESTKRGRETERQSKTCIPGEGESSSEYDYLNEIGESSRSSSASDIIVTEDKSHRAVRSTTSSGRGARGGKIIKKSRGRPRKNMTIIPEDSDDIGN